MEEHKLEMNCLNIQGYAVLKGFLQTGKLKNIESSVISHAKEISRLTSDSFKFDKFHELFDEDKVKYLSMGFENKKINSEIRKLAENSLVPFLTDSLNCECSYEEGGSVITLYPTELTGYKVHYHQDEAVDDREPNRIHVITPLSETPLELIMLLEGTHKVGSLKHTLFGPLIRIEDPKLEDYRSKEVSITLNKGDMLLFYTSLIHRVKDNINSNVSHWMMRFIIKH